jgi:hypothetical protein
VAQIVSRKLFKPDAHFSGGAETEEITKCFSGKEMHFVHTIEQPCEIKKA